MQRWLASICIGVLLVLGVAACQQTPQQEPREEQSTTIVDKDELEQKPPVEEEVEKLTSKLASRDEETFLEAWHPELQNHIDDEAVKEKLMTPEGSVVIMSDPMWSDDGGCWTTDVTIEAPDDLVKRTMCLVQIEGQWYLTNGTR